MNSHNIFARWKLGDRILALVATFVVVLGFGVSIAPLARAGSKNSVTSSVTRLSVYSGKTEITWASFSSISIYWRQSSCVPLGWGSYTTASIHNLAADIHAAYAYHSAEYQYYENDINAGGGVYSWLAWQYAGAKQTAKTKTHSSSINNVDLGFRLNPQPQFNPFSWPTGNFHNFVCTDVDRGSLLPKQTTCKSIAAYIKTK